MKSEAGKLGHSRSRKKSIDEYAATVANVPPAPAPSMYWSRPVTYGKAPKPMRAHTSVMVGELMFVFGGSDHKGCFNTLYILELGMKSRNETAYRRNTGGLCHINLTNLVAEQIHLRGPSQGPMEIHLLLAVLIRLHTMQSKEKSSCLVEVKDPFTIMISMCWIQVMQ